MNNIREELAILISSLNIEKFRLLVQTYLKQKYQTSEVFITDGPYDGGNDLEIRINEKVLRRNIQITVQKNDLEKKLKADLQKASENKNRYNYLGKLDFYCSQHLSKVRLNDLILLAEVEYGIDLVIYDNNLLAQLNEDYPSIKKTTLELLNIRVDEDFIRIDKQTKILFDLLAMGNEAGEVKKQFIFSFIYTFLFENPTSTIEQIMSYVSERLPDVTGIKFYRDALSLLKGKGVLYTDDTKKFFSLSQEKRQEITNIYDKAIMQESVLKEMLHEILSKSKIETEVNEVAFFLYEAYKENYKIDLEELAQNSLSVNSSIKKIYQDLQRFLQNKKLNPEVAKQLTSDILNACNKNEYLNKIGASVLFTTLYKSNKLDEYLNQRTQDYYFDTQVLLQLICYQYEPSDYDDIAFLSVKSLYETCKDFKQKISLNTSYDYLTEVAGHIQEALKLQRFLSLPIFEKFRTSKNIFFNYYIHLQKMGKLEEDLSLEEFINDLLDIETPEFNDLDFIYIVSIRLKAIFEVLV